MPQRSRIKIKIALIKSRIDKTSIKSAIIKIKEKISNWAIKIIVSKDKDEKESNFNWISIKLE